MSKGKPDSASHEIEMKALDMDSNDDGFLPAPGWLSPPIFMLMLGAFLAALFGYYWYEWRTLAGFVAAIDHSSIFMQDFVSHYYPMGRRILETPLPVPGYYYTSFFALLLLPMGNLPLSTALVVWGMIQVASLAALCIIPIRLLRLSLSGQFFYVALFVTSFPILHNLKWGQISILITACVLGAFLAYRSDKRILAGLLLAFAAAIKLYPILFIVYFILKRDLRTLIAFGAAFVLFYFAIPASTLGLFNWAAFETASVSSLDNASWATQQINSQFSAYVGYRWMLLLFGSTTAENSLFLLKVVGYGIALSCLVLIGLLLQKSTPRRFLLSLSALFLSLPFLIATSWPHYFVYLPFCQLAVLSATIPRRSSLNRSGNLVGTLPIFSMFLSSIFLFNLSPDWLVYNSLGFLFFSNLMLLIGLWIIIIKYPADLE